MKKVKIFSYAALLFTCSILLFGCPPKPLPFTPDLTDTTPPVIDIAEVQVSEPGASNRMKRFNIATTDAISGILSTAEINMNISVTATDDQSGIRSILLDISPNPQRGFLFNNLAYRCSMGRADHSTDPILFEPFVNIPIAFSGLVTPPAPSRIFSVFGTSNPLSQANCTGTLPHAGPVDIRGSFRVIVTNNAGVTTTSGFFVFEYADVGIK